MTKSDSPLRASALRALIDPIESDRRSKFLFHRTSYPKSGVHFIGKCSSLAALIACGIGLLGLAGQASAAPIVFQGQNAALFATANPNDTALLMAGIPRPAAPTPAAPQIDVSQLIQQSVISQISNNLYSQISGTATGRATLSDGSSFSWSTNGGSKSIVYTAPDGTTTTIVIPSL